MPGRDAPRCLGWHRRGECGGCLWERECWAASVLRGREGPLERHPRPGAAATEEKKEKEI